MGLDNIQLSPFLVRQLYKKTLFELDSVKSEATAEAKMNIAFLGKNEKNILVIVDSPEAAYLPDEELNLLVGILTACKLSLADVALVNFHHNPGLGYVKLMEDFNPKTVFLFGVQPGDLNFPLHFPDFQLQRYNEQTYLGSPALKLLAANKEQKLALWACLQKYISNN